MTQDSFFLTQLKPILEQELAKADGKDFDADTVKRKGPQIYGDNVPEEDLKFIKEALRSGCELFSRFSVEDQDNCSVSYEFHFGPFRLLNHSLIPLRTQDGKIRIALGRVTMSANMVPADLVITNHNENTDYKYSTSIHKWMPVQRIKLSVTEHDIIWLSARGFSCQEIADMLHKPIDTIRTYRKRIMNKFGSHSIGSALVKELLLN